MSEASYRPSYETSRALVIGINRYDFSSPLNHASNDARVIGEALTSQFGFLKENVALLLDQDATRAGIKKEYLRLASSTVQPNDRVLFFFAGHGHTVSGSRGEVGYLVPVDGRLDDLSTLIRWQELTNDAELIPAKHLLFIMDACYGGLIFKRKLVPPGAARFVRDMLQRTSRQVLTAGKANQVVSDGHGTRPGHSIFTSCVLDGLDGAAAGPEGIITANGLMSYVYAQVSNDTYSDQTPHFAMIDGDGDFIFNPPAISQEETATPVDDLLIKIPSTSLTPAIEEPPADRLKRLIADPASRIQLDDFVCGQLRTLVQDVGPANFPLQGNFTEDVFKSRLEKYEALSEELQSTVILLSKWALPEQLPILEMIFARLGEIDHGNAWNSAAYDFAWYPLFRLQYLSGITALSQGRFDSLRICLLTAGCTDPLLGRSAPKEIVVSATAAVSDMTGYFKKLPDLARRHTPVSDYLFGSLQPILEDKLFFGRSYEAAFDKFEVLRALVYAYVARRDSDTVWGPVGRYAWKWSSPRGTNPFEEFVAETLAAGAGWPALANGFFGGSIEEFRSIADRFRSEFLPRLQMF